MRIFRTSCACVIPRSAIRRTLEKFHAGIWQTVLTRLYLSPSRVPQSSVLRTVSFPHPLFSYCLLDLFLCIFFSLHRGSAEGSDTISATENSGYVSLWIIHCSVDPEGCRSSNKRYLRVLLASFRRSRLRIHVPPSYFMRLPSLYPLLLSFPVIPLDQLDVVIALHYCQKFSIFFTTLFCLYMSA